MLFSLYFTLSSVLIWRGIHAKGKRGLNENQCWSLYRSDISTSRRLNIMQIPWVLLCDLQGVYHSSVSSSERSQGSYWHWEAYESLCLKKASDFLLFFFIVLYGYCVLGQWTKTRKTEIQKWICYKKKTATTLSFASVLLLANLSFLPRDTLD